jgi:hypothetical protein
MNASFPQKEAEMYPIIRDYFLTKVKCDNVFVDGEGGVRLEKNLHIGKIDLAALKNPASKDCEIHLIEAKLFAKRHSFAACVNQITAVRDSADRLWVAFPEAQWKSLRETDRQRNANKLSDSAVGLLLVTSEGCYPEIDAPLNPERSRLGRTEVLEHLGFLSDPFLPQVSSLGLVEAKNAAGTMALTCMVADILYEIEHKRVTFHRYAGYLYNDDFVTNGWFVPIVELSGSLYCELDPFGRLLGDGVPAAWVEVDVPIGTIVARLDRGSGFGTHVYLDDGKWQWKTIPVADGTHAVKHWINGGLNETANLCVRVEIVGRMKSSLKSDLERVINEARRFLSAPTGKLRRAGRTANRTSP